MSGKPRILVVDDEVDFVQLVTLRLEAAGYEAPCAYDGQQALDQVQRLMPDLVILDLMLPRIDGFKVCRLLKFDKRYKKIPVLIMTARAQREDRELAMECGADAYVTKPFNGQLLVVRLQGLLSN